MATRNQAKADANKARSSKKDKDRSNKAAAVAKKKTQKAISKASKNLDKSTKGGTSTVRKDAGITFKEKKGGGYTGGFNQGGLMKRNQIK